MAVPVSAPARGAHLEHPVEQREGLVNAAASEADPRGVGAGALVQPHRGPDTHCPGDPRAHTQLDAKAPERTAVEVHAHPAQADVTPDPAHPGISARPHHP